MNELSFDTLPEGQILKRRLLNAVAEFQRHLDSLTNFSQRQQAYVQEWKQMVNDYEGRLTSDNPYAFPYQGKLFFL
jgi:hypothetical protein